MEDDRSKMDHRNRVAEVEDYEVQYLAQQTAISTEMARELIKTWGTDRQTLLKAAKTLLSTRKGV